MMISRFQLRELNIRKYKFRFFQPIRIPMSHLFHIPKLSGILEFVPLMVINRQPNEIFMKWMVLLMFWIHMFWIHTYNLLKSFFRLEICQLILMSCNSWKIAKNQYIFLSECERSLRILLMKYVFKKACLHLIVLDINMLSRFS